MTDHSKDGTPSGAGDTADHADLFELAHLEVTGVLETHDAARLERLFRESPERVQQKVIELQAALAAQEVLLPDVQPDRALIHEVIASVRRDIRQSDADMAPIASIGVRRGGSSAKIATREDVQDDPTLAVRRVEDLRWKRAAKVWRACCLAAIGGIVVTVAFHISTYRQAVRIGELALQNAVSAQLTSMIGAGLPEFLDQRCVVRGLVGASPRESGSVAVMLSPKFDSVLVAWIDLAKDRVLRLEAVDSETESVTTVGDFTVVNPVGGTRLAVPAGTANLGTVWRVVDRGGAVAFTSKPSTR
ncbi:MAG: hypothetical protein FJ285_04415 [Planctomycetes bacterium]|nr:hypothetical protein [Planctomycetota bacterium]